MNEELRNGLLGIGLTAAMLFLVFCGVVPWAEAHTNEKQSQENEVVIRTYIRTDEEPAAIGTTLDPRRAQEEGAKGEKHRQSEREGEKAHKIRATER